LGGFELIETLIGTRIRARREAIGHKQAEVARRAGISPSYLNLIEHNRRAIAGKVLIDLAAALNVDVTALTHGAQTGLIEELQGAAAAAESPVELLRTEEMAGRFPGWSRLTARLHQKVARLERTVDGLTDRLTHDPFLSESLHEMLSTVTAIRATSSILAQMPDVGPDQQARFHNNLFSEAQRLSDLSVALVSYFDRLSEAEQSLSTPLDELEAFLNANDYHFSPLESGDRSAIDALVEGAASLASLPSRTLARRHLAQYCRDARRLPLAEFLPAARLLDFYPEKLAAELGADLPAIFRRLAFMPGGADVPSFGLMVCDVSGSVILRKPLPGFSLPRYGAGCPLWPLYQAIAQPHVPVKAILETPDGAPFVGFAQCVPLGTEAFNAPRVLASTMLFLPLSGTPGQSELVENAPKIETGPSCRICPRSACPARREPSIHSMAE
jgi:XRE family transcriptional regulator, fatty acid utilization regulator